MFPFLIRAVTFVIPGEEGEGLSRRIFPGAAGAFYPDPEPELPKISLLRIPDQGVPVPYPSSTIPVQGGMDARPLAIRVEIKLATRFDTTQEKRISKQWLY